MVGTDGGSGGLLGIGSAVCELACSCRRQGLACATDSELNSLARWPIGMLFVELFDEVLVVTIDRGWYDKCAKGGPLRIASTASGTDFPFLYNSMPS